LIGDFNVGLPNPTLKTTLALMKALGIELTARILTLACWDNSGAASHQPVIDRAKTTVLFDGRKELE
jgi:hypothetical protein